MNFEHILYEKADRIARITLNRPEVMNAMRPSTCLEVAAAFRDYRKDDALHVAILTGAGERAFCVGADLKYRAQEGPPAPGKRPGDEMGEAMARCNKPIIAAVNGYAVGGGFELALRCDIIVAADHAQFGLPEVKRSLVADAGGLYLLPRRIPYHLAMGLMLTGEFFGAQEGWRMGLVNQVVPQRELAAAAGRWADKILECGPLALQAAKEMVRAYLQMAEEPDITTVDGWPAVRRLRESEDYLEGPRAFAEKRPPVWKGR